MTSRCPRKSDARQATYTYDPYGRLAAATVTPGYTVNNPFGFAGQYTDAETGFQYLRARYYDPTDGQFLTRDPIEALTREAYSYAGNNPVNFTDPTGLYWGEGVVDFFTGGGCGPSLGDALDGLGNLLGDIGSSALDNSFLRGVATTFVVSSFCASTGGIGCLLLVGGLTGAGLSGLNYYVNDKQGGLGGHVAVGLISGSTSGVSAGIWGMLAKGPTQGAFTFFRTSVPGSVTTASMAQRARFFVGGAASWMIGR